MGCFEVDCSDFCNTIDLVKKAYPKKVKKFMQKEGNKLKRKVTKTAKNRVKKKTGSYEKSIKRGKHYKWSGNGGDAIRVYSAAPHSHLIEDGHTQDTKNGEIFVEGKHVFADSRKEFEAEFLKDVDNFIDTVTEEFN